MIAISFTGPAKRLTDDDKELVRSVVEGLRDPEEFYSGAAWGIDIYAAEVALRAFPSAHHEVIIPMWAPNRSVEPRACRHADGMIGWLQRVAAAVEADLAVSTAPAGIGKEATGLLRRDDVLAERCTHMVAFPRTSKEHRRSGTWATIRRGRKLKRPILLAPLNGDQRTILRASRGFAIFLVL